MSGLTSNHIFGRAFGWLYFKRFIKSWLCFCRCSVCIRKQRCFARSNGLRSKDSKDFCTFNKWVFATHGIMMIHPHTRKDMFRLSQYFFYFWTIQVSKRFLSSQWVPSVTQKTNQVGMNDLHYNKIQCNVMQCNAVQCNTLHYIISYYFTLQHITLHYIMLHYIILHYITTKHNTTWHDTTQHDTT